MLRFQLFPSFTILLRNLQAKFLKNLPSLAAPPPTVSILFFQEIEQFRVERVALNASGNNPAFAVDVCAFGDSFGIVFAAFADPAFAAASAE